MKKVFIQTNNKQLLGALLAKYAIQKNLRGKRSVAIDLINVDNLDIFKRFHGKEYLRKGKARKYDSNDLQSFTLTRFMPPELMAYGGRAVVIDPDIFALVDINELFNIDMQGKAIACRKKTGTWESSVMLLDCEKLAHWKISDILKKLENKDIDYSSLITLKYETAPLEIDPSWNNLDYLSGNTKMLHTTERLTQPWKTGLPVDFTEDEMPKFLGVIPREPLYTLLGKKKTAYQPHPDKNIERFFFGLIRDALKANFISQDFLRSEIEKRNVRQDISQVLQRLA